jgi:flagellar biosynthetic protein FlhB
MAEEQDKSQKTEDPTQKRLEEARKKGDVAKSQDVPVWFLLAAAAAIMAAAGPLATSIADPLVRIMDHPHAFRLTDGGAQQLLTSLLMSLFTPMAVVFGVLLVAGLLGHLIQHRPMWTMEKMKLDIGKLDPMKGFGRLFGAQGWVNLLKSVMKMCAVSAAMMYAVLPELGQIIGAGMLDPGGLLHITQSIAGRLMIAALVAIGVIAGMDYAWQRFSFFQRMKMSKQEVKDENKQSEGDPHIKAKLRQIRLERSRKRMMANVAKATVVITNPTHYAVALRYLPDTDAAPVCMAKGVDDLALRIREEAKKHDVPIVENVALARALFPLVEIEEPIPREHFEAVAKVIGFILNTAKNKRRPT